MQAETGRIRSNQATRKGWQRQQAGLSRDGSTSSHLLRTILSEKRNDDEHSENEETRDQSSVQEPN